MKIKNLITRNIPTKMIVINICLKVLTFLMFSSCLNNNSNKKIRVDFYLNIDEQKSFWVGDILRFEDDKGRTLGLLSKTSSIQTARPSNMKSISLDILDNSYIKKSISLSDFQLLGSPGKNSAYIDWNKGVLTAYSYEKRYCLNTPDAKWTECEGDKKDSIIGNHYLRWIPNPMMDKFFKGKDLSNTQPLYIGESLVLFKMNDGSLVRCELLKIQCISVKGIKKIPWAYTYDLVGDNFAIYATTGDTFSYSISKNELKLQPSRKKSNQFYASYILKDQVLLGHYPTGGLFGKKFRSESILGIPPKQDNHSSDLRELQSIGYIGGKLLIGLWPWGEIWESDSRKKTFKFNHFLELFEIAKSDKDTKVHPLKHVLGLGYDHNELGRRISSIVPCWDGVCISTSSKAVKIKSADINKNKFISKKEFMEYGKVLYLPGPKSSCDINIVGSHHYSMIIKNKSVTISKNDKVVCTMSFSKRSLLEDFKNLYRVKVLSSIGHKNNHSGQIRLMDL